MWMIAVYVAIYLLPGIAGIAVQWNSFEMFGSQLLARIVMVVGWPYFMIVMIGGESP